MYISEFDRDSLSGLWIAPIYSFRYAWNGSKKSRVSQIGANHDRISPSPIPFSFRPYDFSDLGYPLFSIRFLYEQRAHFFGCFVLNELDPHAR